MNNPLPDSRDSVVFPAKATYPSSLADMRTDAWKTLRLAASGPCSLDAMRLIRWDGFREFLGKRWTAMEPETVEALRDGIADGFSPESVCIRYDDFSFLVICRDAADPMLGETESGIINAVGAKIALITGNPGLIRVWTPVSIEDEGFGFARTGSEQPVPPQPEAVPEAAPTRPAYRVMADPEFRYYPLWDVRGNDIFCYLCEALWDVGAGVPMSENALGEMFADPKRKLVLDLSALRKAVAQIEEVIERYGVLRVLIPVHYDTLADAGSAATYIKQCKQVVWSVVDYVFFEIIAPSADLPPGELGPLAELIRPYGNGVMLRVAPGFNGFDGIAQDGFMSVGLDLRGEQREEEIISELGRFAAAASACGLSGHVHGLETVTASVAAVSAGFDYVGSDNIAPALDNWNPDDDKAKSPDFLQTLLNAKRKS